ncbi:hypothetical protein C2S52_020443 [Perilla frutescens var. hirtella]|nr:hypothetical protein C2S52_020443 [Perilla frutescens var. hirtella]
MSFQINDSVVDFGPSEFAIMTGLKFHDWAEPPETSNFHNTVFNGKRALLFVDIHNHFLNECGTCGGNSLLALKLAFLCVLYGILLVRDRKSEKIKLQYMHIIDDLEKFNNYPWGRISYEFLVRVTHALSDFMDRRKQQGTKAKLVVDGFTVVLQTWAYEVISNLGARCAIRCEDMDGRLPRILHWKVVESFDYDVITTYFLPSNVKPIEEERQLLLSLGVSKYDSPGISSIPAQYNSKLKRRRLHFDEVVVGHSEKKENDGEVKFRGLFEEIYVHPSSRILRSQSPEYRRELSPAISKTDESCEPHKLKAEEWLDSNDLLLAFKKLMVKISKMDDKISGIHDLLIEAKLIHKQHPAKLSEKDMKACTPVNKPARNLPPKSLSQQWDMKSSKVSQHCGTQLVNSSEKMSPLAKPEVATPNSIVGGNSTPYDPHDSNYNQLDVEKPLSIHLPTKVITEVKATWFNDICDGEGWLREDHIDVLINLLILKYKKEPHRFKKEWACMEQICWISIKEQKITVYDSMSYLTEWSVVSKPFHLVAKFIPLFLYKTNIWLHKGYTEPLKPKWDVVCCTENPNQTNNGDCGIMAMKYMECLVSGQPISSIDPDRCRIFRRSYCAQLYKFGMDEQKEDGAQQFDIIKGTS